MPDHSPFAIARVLLNKSQGGGAKVAIKYNVCFIECKGTGEVACNQLSANFIRNDIRKDGGGGQVLGSESRVQWRRITNGEAIREVVNEVRKTMGNVCNTKSGTPGGRYVRGNVFVQD